MPMMSDKYTYIFGAPSASDRGMLALVADDDAARKVDILVPVLWQASNWSRSPATAIELAVCGLAITQDPFREGAFLGLEGEVFFWGANGAYDENIATPSASPGTVGMMRSIRAIGGKAYAVGMQRQVYRRDGVNGWVDLSQAIRPAQGSDAIVSFEAIDGFGADELYACGRDGEIWWFDARTWRQIASPTTVNLTNVVCAADGNAYICGRTGVLLKGRRDRWDVIPQDLVEQDFWGIAWFRDRLYLATMNLLLELSGGTLSPVAFADDFPRTCFHLAVALDGSVLWSTGAKDVFSFDGITWTRID